MSLAAIRRIVLVLVFYAVGAWLVLRGAAWLEATLALPRLFRTLMIAVIGVGIPLAVAVAWRYPEMGSAARSTEEPRDRGSGTDGARGTG